MEEKELKTSLKQRIFIAAIAIIMVGSIIAGYAAIVLGNSGSSSTAQTIAPEKVVQYQQEYEAKQAEFKTATQADFDKFVPFKSEVVAYNEATANAGEVVTQDLVVGEGRELTEGDKDYLAYYIGWCADETVFDSSLDNTTNPTMFTQALNASAGLIDGWERGVVGMKLGGIREITIPGELAYKDTQEICGGTYKPLKFIVMAVANEEPLKTLNNDLMTAYYKVQYANDGIDYEEMMTGAATGSTTESATEGTTSGE